MTVVQQDLLVRTYPRLAHGLLHVFMDKCLCAGVWPVSHCPGARHQPLRHRHRQPCLSYVAVRC